MKFELTERERRVLVLASVGRDAELTCAVLKQAGFPCSASSDFETFCHHMDEGAAVSVIAEETLSTERIQELQSVLQRQPNWSDLPFVILTTGGRTTEVGQRRAEALEQLGHFVLIERPVRTGTLLSAVRAAWRSRLRQYELRDYLAERERAEHALIQQAESLARANADLEQFAYVTSHDLKEPLRSIAGFAQLLARNYQGKLDADADEFITYITSGVQRMQAVIEDLLTYSRVVHQPSKKFQPVDLQRVVEWATENLQCVIEENQASIRAHHLPTIQGDQIELITLFQNLISNAVKYRRQDAPVNIDIAAKRQDESWLVTVADNGTGFKPEYAERIFELFKRLHGREVPGTGLGLTICRKVVQRHGGRMWAESNGEGTGAKFQLLFPAR